MPPGHGGAGITRRPVPKLPPCWTRLTPGWYEFRMPTTASLWWRPWHTVAGATMFHVDLAPHADHEASAFSLLDGEEKARWHRFLVPGAGRRFALCRAALRVNLAERLDCSNSRLSFRYGEHGKPYALVDGQRVHTGFNVSHCGLHGLLVFASNDRIGIDVAERTPGRDLDGIASLVYGPLERRMLSLASGLQKEHLFFRLWSMKEALIKALGSGFSLNPSGFEVPEAMLRGARSGVFRFPHAPTDRWHLIDLGEHRFAAALAYRIPD